MISCGGRNGARLLSACLVAALLAVPAVAGKRAASEDEDYLNVLLSPGLAQWLIGPIARLATKKEVRAYLELTDDEAANRFIDAFWKRRFDPENPWPGKQMRDIFDARAEEADRLFSEGTYIGRRTDRGITYVMYGEPGSRNFVQELGPRQSTIEIWSYAGQKVLSLDGTRPKVEYYFMRKGDRTVFSRPPKDYTSARRRRTP